jgi:hypothetical protein
MDWRISFSDGIGIAGIILATVLLVLDKAGKLRGGMLIGLLCVAGVMTLFVAVRNSFVLDAPPKWKIWRGLFMVGLVAFCYSGLAIWISGGSTENAEAPAAPPPRAHEEVKKTESAAPRNAHRAAPARAKPDIGAEFVRGTSPGIALTSLSDAVVRDPTCLVSAWNLDSKLNLPAFNQSEAGLFVKKGNGILVASLDNPNMKPLIKPGDRVFGFVAVDCPDCLETKYYWLFVVYGGDSWYSPIPKGSLVNALDINQRLISVNWDVEEFMKQVPHGERLPPRPY